MSGAHPSTASACAATSAHSKTTTCSLRRAQKYGALIDPLRAALHLPLFGAQ